MNPRSLFKKIKERLFFGYHAVRYRTPVWRYVLNRKLRRVWKKVNPRLNPAQKEVAEMLLKDGIAITHLDALFPGVPVLEELRKAAEEKIAEYERHHSGNESDSKAPEKFFIRFFWGGGGTYPEIEMENRMIRFALDEKILGVIGAYMGMCPRFDGFSLQETILMTDGAKRSLSQKWHRDPGDKKIVKIFVYLNDVHDEGAGPFMYMRKSHAHGRWARVFPQNLPFGIYPPAQKVEAMIPLEAKKLCTGRAGTLIFCDTTGLHRGGYSITSNRRLFTAGFSTDAMREPATYTHIPDSEKRAGSTLARMALSRKKPRKETKRSM